ncbi:hypothetical protein DFJ74DRAFT_25365 [Hyaloraphidium curvatum]|nr:hypothetical protein DFJ74DRAFT_25365 [Hyaloraphidium curvatum]
MLTHLSPDRDGAAPAADDAPPPKTAKGGSAVPAAPIVVDSADEMLEEDIAPVTVVTSSPPKARNGAAAAKTPAAGGKTGPSKQTQGKSAASAQASTKKKDDPNQKKLDSFFKASPAPAAAPASASAPPQSKAQPASGSPKAASPKSPAGASASEQDEDVGTAKPAAKAKSAPPASGVKPVRKPGKAAAADEDDSPAPPARKRKASPKAAPKKQPEPKRNKIEVVDPPSDEEDEDEDEDEESGSDFAGSGSPSESSSSSSEEAESSSAESEPASEDDDSDAKSKRKSKGKGKEKAPSPPRRKLKRPAVASESEGDAEMEEERPKAKAATPKGKGKAKRPADSESDDGGDSEPKPGPSSKGKGKAAAGKAKKSPGKKAPAKKRARKSSDDENGEAEGSGAEKEAEKEEESSEGEEDENGVNRKKVDIRPKGKPVKFLSEEDVEAAWEERAADKDSASGEDEERASASGSGSNWLHVRAKEATKKQPVKAKPGRKKAKKGSDDDEEDEDENQDGGAPHKSKIAKHLAPLQTPQEHISDQVKRMNTPEQGLLAELVAHLNGRSLRIATMGTEAPIIALTKIQNALFKEFGILFKFESVFSCEIEPFKQAYIERNFKPPILFRDVKELGRDEAHTAYGALVAVPGDIDILVAGTSCVDFSGLNNKQKNLQEMGESGSTFFGMLRYVKKHLPPIVILENVCGAPWTKQGVQEKIQKAKEAGKKPKYAGKSIEEHFNEIGYFGTHVRLDTKEFSIPHTRTRGYFMACRVEGISEEWKERVESLKRGWTVPIDGYLLPVDHPDIAKARAFYARKQTAEGKSRNSRNDWSKCESRHARYREENMLGNKRPLTAWHQAGVCKGLDFAWNDWFTSQTERVVDLLDINTLKVATSELTDPSFKTFLWNVSQNVDRNTHSGHIGLSPCLTPSMIPYITSRGGPATGREALALQGIDYMDLHLTVETEDQLADLAGNAMSTTVISAAMLSALSFGKDLLNPGDGTPGGSEQQQSRATADVVEDDALHRGSFALSGTTQVALRDILRQANLSSRRCMCEAGDKIAAETVMQCVACHNTACKSCGGRPEHLTCTFDGSELTEADWIRQSSAVAEASESPNSATERAPASRLPPKSVEQSIKSLLPMCLQLDGLGLGELDALRAACSEGAIKDADWTMWADAVHRMQRATVYFRALIRDRCWIASYESPYGRLELRLQPQAPEWLLFGMPDKDLPVGHDLRALFKNPVARLKLDKETSSLTGGKWEICLPTKQKFDVEFVGEGELVDSWQASLGVVMPEFKDTKRWSQYAVTASPVVEAELDRPISGTYVLLDKCGTSQNSLHRKKETAEDRGLPPLFFFHDATPTAPLDEDAFVFSTDSSRGGFKYFRPIVAKIDAKWRTNDKPGTEVVPLHVMGKWVPAEAVHFVPAHLQGERQNVDYEIARTIDTSAATASCRHAHVVLKCEFPLPIVQGTELDDLWKSSSWRDIDLLREGSSTFRKLAWVTSLLPELSIAGETAASDERCSSCAPLGPAIEWVQTAKQWMPVEDAREATEYEIAIKNRPAPFMVQIRADPISGLGFLRLSLNAASLAHQALSMLPRKPNVQPPRVTWKLAQDYTGDHEHAKRVFTLSSNRNDPQHAQPPSFKLNLRPEQLRSLSWMLEQEKDPEKFTFEEKEIVEADLPAFGLRVEAHASRLVEARGGVIADQVGYGKTAISIGLIRQTRDIQLPVADDALIPLKATLVVTPAHLGKQWKSEFDKFVSSGVLKILEIPSVAQLYKHSIKDLQEADVIITNATLLKSPVYLERLGHFAGSEEDLLSDKNGGRLFQDTISGVLAGLREQTRLLKDNKIDEVNQRIADAKKRAVALAAKRAKVAADLAEQGRKKSGKAQPKPKKEPKRKDDVKTNLGDKNVKESFRNIKGAPLQMFSFKRLIIDEYTYLEGLPLAAMTGIKASSRWILSGTPPVEDFGSIKGIAAFLGIHLGVDDDKQGIVAQKTVKTAAEQFHGYREVHSSAWHAARDDVAQAFLDKFLRQNVAEIDLIPRTDICHQVCLPSDERTIYLELEHHLLSIEMLAKAPKTFKDVSVGDRNNRLQEVLADSKDAEEALLKRAAHFSPDFTRESTAENAQEACDDIAKVRRDQRLACQVDFAREVAYCRILALQIAAGGGYPPEVPKPPIEEFARSVFALRLSGDRFADRLLAEIMDNEGFTPQGKLKKYDVVDRSGKLSDTIWELRERVIVLRKISKELAGRCRSLRFFETIRNIQRGGAERDAALERSVCSHQGDGVEMGVLSCCGHVACLDCLKNFAGQQRCVHDADVCAAPVRATNVVPLSILSSVGAEETSGKFGAKLQRLVDIVRRIPAGERCLIFVQFFDMFKKVAEALGDAGITCATLDKGTANAKSKILDDFQSPNSKHRVLLLNLDNETASGANLTVANHIIFLSPLKTPTQASFDAKETQAIGRAVRYGQTKPMVYIHRLFALDTVDIDIMRKRRPELDIPSLPPAVWDRAKKQWIQELGNGPTHGAGDDDVEMLDD